LKPFELISDAATTRLPKSRPRNGHPPCP